MTVINFSGHEINNKTVPALMGVISNEINDGVEEITLAFSSPGGQVTEGIALYNFLKGVPAKLTVHNIGQVDSIANVIFMAGDERLAVPTSSFFFHDVGITVNGNIRLIEENLNEQLSIIRRDRKKIIDVMTADSDISEKRLNELFLHSESITPQEAKDNDIIHDIRAFVIPKGEKILTLNFQ